jgi:transmembrane 9 superfamily protein 3
LCIDNLPVSGIVGANAEEEQDQQQNQRDPHFKPLYVYTHKEFTIGYNGNNVRRKCQKMA